MAMAMFEGLRSKDKGQRTVETLLWTMEVSVLTMKLYRWTMKLYVPSVDKIKMCKVF